MWIRLKFQDYYLDKKYFICWFFNNYSKSYDDKDAVGDFVFLYYKSCCSFNKLDYSYSRFYFICG